MSTILVLLKDHDWPADDYPKFVWVDFMKHKHPRDTSNFSKRVENEVSKSTE